MVTHGSKVVRGLGPDRRSVLDFHLWDGGTVELTRIQVIKGVVQADGRRMHVHAATHCWIRETYIREELIGRRVRVYGTDNELSSEVLGPLITAGIFAVQVFNADGTVSPL